MQYSEIKHRERIHICCCPTIHNKQTIVIQLRPMKEKKRELANDMICIVFNFSARSYSE